jgi:carbamoylphosphate synthase large subunit
MIDQRVLFQLDLAVLTRLEKTITQNNKLDNLLPLLAGTQADDVIKSLVQQIQDLENKRSNMRFMATEENAAIIAMDREISAKRFSVLRVQEKHSPWRISSPANNVRR